MSAPRVGDPAPAFALPGIDGATGERRIYRSEEFAGAPLIIAFYPADDSPVCTQQLIEHTKGIAELAAVGARLVSVSPQDAESHASFATRHGGFAFPMLCDEDRVMGRAYGVVGLLDLYRRSTILIDARGIISYVQRSVGRGSGFKPLSELMALVQPLATDA